MRRADFRALVATERATIPGPRPLRRFSNRNELLFSYRWTEGGKTGFTNLARRCLVASASRGGRRLLAVALGSPNAFTDLRALFEYGFTALVRARLARAGQVVARRLAAGRSPPTWTRSSGATCSAASLSGSPRPRPARAARRRPGWWRARA